MKQIKFEFFRDYKMSFGGEDLLGKRKAQRPLSIKSPLHLVLRSGQKKVFDPGNRRLQKLSQDMAAKFNVKIFDIAINWSHIHFLIQVKERKNYVRFIRALTSKLAMAVKRTSLTLSFMFSRINWKPAESSSEVKPKGNSSSREVRPKPVLTLEKSRKLLQ